VVIGSDGRAGRVERVLIEPGSGAPRAIVVRTGRFFGAHRVVPIAWVDAVDDAAVTLRAARADLARLPEHRGDARVRADVRSRLMDDDPIRAVALRHTTVDVLDGVVTMRGRVPSRSMADRMVEIAGSAPGVARVVDELVADDALALAVAQAIGRTPSTRGSRLQIRADRGRVLVGGVFPSWNVHEEAVRIAAAVEGVVSAEPAP
jgi:osmotically-inducible protein OsmY